MPAKQRTSSISFSEKILAGDRQFNQSPSQESYPGLGMPASPNEESSGDSDSGNAKDPTVPERHSHRTVVLCFDGTGGLLASHSKYSAPLTSRTRIVKVINSTMTFVFATFHLVYSIDYQLEF